LGGGFWDLWISCGRTAASGNGAAACYFWPRPFVEQIMNEQLVVKNFGPIKDATVNFKRVTVFIGPTGGGKSTLAKLAAVCKDKEFIGDDIPNRKALLKSYSIDSYVRVGTSFKWLDESGQISFNENFDYDAKPKRENRIRKLINTGKDNSPDAKAFTERVKTYSKALQKTEILLTDEQLQVLAMSIADMLVSKVYPISANYVPSERSFVSSISSSFAGLMRDDIGIAKPLLKFANDFFQSREEVYVLGIPFLNVEYFRHDTNDYINFLNEGKQDSLLLHETASGIQSVTPLLVLLEHLSRNTEQAQSFIIEEPELNLYPTAQQGLLNWLVEKCTKGENDLTITTHSPYLLAHFNLLLYAYQVAENHPDRADDVAKIVPRESWINPKEFAAYHVEGQQENGVRSIINPETGLISYNGLDATASAETAEFEKLLDINAGLEIE
jgi:predicted ATPase